MTVEFHDLVGLEKPLLKLMDCLQKGCSWCFEPIQIKRIVKAEAEASWIRNIADFKNTLAEALSESVTSELENARVTRQMHNIASIYSMAAQELQMIDKIDDTPVGNEWSAMFFDYAKDVDDEKIQIIWSKILAGEISKSGTFFKRTLSVLKNIEPFEAEWFVEACSLVFFNSVIDKHLSSEIIAYNKIQSLMDCGLVNATECCMAVSERPEIIPFKTCIVKKENNEPFDDFSINGLYTLTDAGCQLYEITQVKTNMDYASRVKEKFSRLCKCELTLSTT